MYFSATQLGQLDLMFVASLIRFMANVIQYFAASNRVLKYLKIDRVKRPWSVLQKNEGHGLYKPWAIQTITMLGTWTHGG